MEYLEALGNIQQNFLNFILSQENKEEDSLNLTKLLDNPNVKKDSSKLREVLHLISKVSENHFKNHDFMQKIESIILIFKEQINQIFTNKEVWTIFRKNKRILLFLLNNKIITVDSSIANKIAHEADHYQCYFYPEIKPFIKEELRASIESKINSINNFEEKRKEGENDSYICQLIRNDSIDEFVIHVNQTNLPLSTQISQSIFETNSFLINKEPTLIEYSAFFGSIQIFKYLQINNNKLLTPSLWLYSIHGMNHEIISILEENHIKPKVQSFKDCLFESIKCHHNEISNYFLDQNSELHSNEIEFQMFLNALKYHNYAYFPKKINDTKLFYFWCKYDYLYFVELLLKENKIDLNLKTIQK